jgi:hypothetical protein
VQHLAAQLGHLLGRQHTRQYDKAVQLQVPQRRDRVRHRAEA